MSTVPHVILVKTSPASVSTQKSGTENASSSWQRDLAAAIRTSEELFRRLQLSIDELEHNQHPQSHGDGTALHSNFPVLVPDSFIRRMTPGNWNDPLLLQVLPSAAEFQPLPGFVSDAVGDLAARRAPGLIHKYRGRVLLVAAGACAVHCRYCFRREYPYQNDPHRLDEWQPAMDAIAQDQSVREVILSGGDPLMLNDARLATICYQLDQISHVERIRIHSRMPIVLPSRVTADLLALPLSLRSQVIMVVHANHPNEIAGDCSDALQKMTRAGMPVLNQAVLLKRINDDVDTLEQLCRRLINLGVMPYYLHQLDRVQGTAHFEVATDLGQQLIDQLTTRLPGYAVPRYVREVPGAPSKTPI